jgi:hypothetical protein
MPLVARDARWTRNRFDRGGPYCVEAAWHGDGTRDARIGWVVDRAGTNVLRCLSAPGAVMTTRDEAQQLADTWNQ